VRRELSICPTGGKGNPVRLEGRFAGKEKLGKKLGAKEVKKIRHRVSCESGPGKEIRLVAVRGIGIGRGPSNKRMSRLGGELCARHSFWGG